MVHAKKFIVAFLILAALASSSALIMLQESGGGGANPAALGSNEELAQATSAYMNGTSAFVPTSNDIAIETAAGVIMAASSSPDNITNQIASAFADNVTFTVPDATSGLITANAPTQDVLAAAITSSSILSNIQIPNWDKMAAAMPLTVSSDTSPSAVSSYASALENIFSEYAIKDGLLGLASDPNAASQTNAAFAAATIGDAVKQLSSETVPANFVNFQKSVVRAATYDENTLALIEAAPNDPVKAYAIAQGEQAGMTSALIDLQSQWQKALANGAFAAAIMKPENGRPSGAVAFMNNLAGVNIAHAQYTDFVAFAERIGMYLLQYAMDIALQLLKNVIIGGLESKALSFINNKGNPMFIRAFAPYLADAFNVAAGAAINQVDAGFCTGFQKVASKWLKGAFQSANLSSNAIALSNPSAGYCTLQAAVPNLAGFAQSFNLYGFNGFATVLQIKNNPYGAMLDAYDKVQAAAASNESTAQTKAIAGQGYTGQTQCGSQGASTTQSGSCLTGSLESVIHTPGKFLSDYLGKRTASDQQLTSSANNIVGLLTTVAQNAITGAISKSGLF